MGMVTKEIQIGQQPTAEMLKEVEDASKRRIMYDSDSPKLTTEQLAEFRPVIAKYYKPKKEQITLKIDADVLAAYRSMGKGYQTKMNTVLRKAVFNT